MQGLLFPFLLALAAVAFLIAILIWAPDGARDAVRSEYAAFVKLLAASIGPTAAAFLGDLAAEATRPKFDATTPRRAVLSYQVGRIASLCLFGFLGGAGASALEVKAAWAYVAAAAGGHIGVHIINIITNRLLDKYLPPTGGKP